MSRPGPLPPQAAMLPWSDSRLLNIRALPAIGCWPRDVRRIDRRSPYGNPFIIGERCARCWQRVNRAEVLAMYAEWLERQVLAVPGFLEPLRGKRLACWCTPLACHGALILAWLDAHAPQVWVECNECPAIVPLDSATSFSQAEANGPDVYLCASCRERLATTL